MQSHYTRLTYEACPSTDAVTCLQVRYMRISVSLREDNTHSITVSVVDANVTVRLSARAPLNVYKAVYLSCFRDLAESIRYTRASIQGRTVRDPGSYLTEMIRWKNESPLRFMKHVTKKIG